MSNIIQIETDIFVLKQENQKKIFAKILADHRIIQEKGAYIASKDYGIKFIQPQLTTLPSCEQEKE